MTNVPKGTAAFFDAVRPLFGGKLSQSQVDGINVILGAFKLYGDGSATKLAYILATAFHETGGTMQPVKETQFTADVPTDALVKQRLTKAWKAGKLPWVKSDYWSGGFFGRGYVQLTHKANYVKAGKVVGVDLFANPDKALDPGIASRVLVQGMMEGWFTGKPLGKYITGTEFDFRDARRVVNGVESAEKVKEHAERFLFALRAAEAAERPKQHVPAPEPDPTDSIAPPPKKRTGFPWWIVGLLAVVGALAAFGIDWPTGG